MGAVVAFMTSHALGQRRIEHASPGFSVVLPSGFTPVEEPLPPNCLYAFQKPLQGEARIAITIEDLGGAIGPEKLTKADIPPEIAKSANIDIEYWPLKRVQLSVIVVRHATPLGPFVTMGAQIPLNRRGIQIGVAGPAAQEQELRLLLQGLLGSFDGELIVGRLPDGRVILVKKMPLGERIATLAWSIVGIGGWIALLSYWVFRLCIIGKADRFVRSRKTWLAVAGLGIFLGGTGRGIASTVYHKPDTLSAILNLLIGALVLNAYLRLSKRAQLRQTCAADASGSEEAATVHLGGWAGEPVARNDDRTSTLPDG